LASRGRPSRSNTRACRTAHELSLNYLCHPAARQYVAPEVVTGFGEVDPTEKPYGKECDMWSMGVLLYVMLSKTMPFRAKEVDMLLKQASPVR
jgi:serine/threonine protein kinase